MQESWSDSYLWTRFIGDCEYSLCEKAIKQIKMTGHSFKLQCYVTVCIQVNSFLWTIARRIRTQAVDKEYGIKEDYILLEKLPLLEIELCDTHW